MFFVSTRESTVYKQGMQIRLRFQITQHSRDAALLRSLREVFGCGNYCADSEHGNFAVTKFSDITEKIIPFFEKYPLVGSKRKDFRQSLMGGLP
jgi:hypothetical protein